MNFEGLVNRGRLQLKGRLSLRCSALAAQSTSNIREEHEQNPTRTPDSTGQGAAHFSEAQDTLCVSQAARLIIRQHCLISR